MTLKTNQGGNRPTGSMGTAYAEATARQASQGQDAGRPAADEPREGAAPNQAFSIRAMSSLFDLPMAANTQSEVLAKARSVMEAEIKSVPDQVFDIKLVGLDRDNAALHLGVSVLVIGVSVRQNQNYGIGYHTLLLAASAPEPAPQVVQIGQGKTVELKQTIGDAWDDIMRAEVRKELIRLFPNTNVFSGEARVVPADFNWDDAGKVKTLRAEVVTAATMALAKSLPDFNDVNLRKIEVDNTLSLHTQFNQPQIADSVGNPVRADIRITFKAGQTQRNPNQAQSQNLEKPTDITSIAAYLDLIHQRQQVINPYLPQAPQQFQPGQPNPYQQYIPRLVITRLRSGRAATLSQQLLALVTVYTLRKPGAWYQNFKPQYHLGREKDIDLKDIGVLGIETMVDPATGIGQRINTKTDTFRPQDLGMLLQATVKPGLVISMDINECGDDTWMNADFAAAAQTANQEARRIANEKLFDAVNFLTSGEFAKTGFVRGNEICFNENNRIANGYYTGRDGERRDKRDLDYVAMMNLMGERDIKVVRDWTDTYLRSDFPLEQRLDARLQIEQSLMPDMKITGYSTRITFRDDFLQCFTKAVAATGLAIKEAPMFADTQGFDVPTYQFASAALGGYEQSNLFQQGGGMGGGTSYVGGAGRWR